MNHSNVIQAFSWVRRTLAYDIHGVPTATNVSTITSNFTARILARVRELQIGEPNLATSNSVQIPVRLVDHATPYAGGGSTYVNGATVRLTVSGGHTVAPLVQTTDTNGIAIFTYSLGGVPDGLDNLLAWWDGSGSLSTNLDTYQDAYASAKVTNGVVVSLVASPDVAEDHDAVGVRQRGQFRFRRSGSSANPLTVRYQVATNYDYPTFTTAPNSTGADEINIDAATSMVNVAATYGSSSGQDYTLSAVSPATRVAPSGYPFAGTLTFASGQVEAILEVVPRQDELTETNIVSLWLLTSSTNTYALGPQTNATVSIYDGPEWTAYAVTDYTAPVKVTGINNDTTPVVSGRRYYSQYPYSGLDGGWWSADFLNGFYRMATNFSYGNTPEPNGVSDTVGGAIRFAGYRNPGGGGVMQAWRGW